MKRSNLSLFAAMFAAMAASANAALISEFEPNPEGTDPATTRFEVSGAPGAAYSLTLLTVEAETNFGTIDSFVTASGNFDANGLAILTNQVDVENPAYTVLLVTGFTGAVGGDVDTNNDGVIDTTPWTAIEDSLNVPDAGSVGSGDRFYGTSSIIAGPVGFDDEPILAFRDASTGAWYSVHEIQASPLTYQVFDSAGAQVSNSAFNVANPALTTYSAINPTTVPEPSTAVAALMGLSAIGALSMRARLG